MYEPTKNWLAFFFGKNLQGEVNKPSTLRDKHNTWALLVMLKTKKKVSLLVGKIGSAETPVQYTKISKVLNPMEAVFPVLIVPCPALPCPFSVLFCPVKHSPNRWTTSSPRPVPRPRYHRALCLLWWNECIRWISGDSNIKKPSRFNLTSWIVTFQEAFDGVNLCTITYAFYIATELRII